MNQERGAHACSIVVNKETKFLENQIFMPADIKGLSLIDGLHLPYYVHTEYIVGLFHVHRATV